MKKLKELAERYLKIVGKYDAGRKYTWSEAAKDLRGLASETSELEKHSRSRGAKHLARLLGAEIKEEADRVAGLK